MGATDLVDGGQAVDVKVNDGAAALLDAVRLLDHKNVPLEGISVREPSLDYRGVRIDAAMKQYDGRPAMLIASSHDPYAARTVRDSSCHAPTIRAATAVCARTASPDTLQPAPNSTSPIATGTR